MANLLAALAALPAVFLFRATALAIGAEGAFPAWSQIYSLLPGLSGVYLRRGFYRLVLPNFAGDACLHFGTILSSSNTSIGGAVYVGPYCVIGDVVLEDDVLVASHVSILSGGRQHGTARLDIPVRKQLGVKERLTIGRDSWIGERSVVMANVGRHCVVGAGAVVTKPLPDYAIAVGVPARIVGYRNQEGGGEVACPDAS